MRRAWAILVLLLGAPDAWAAASCTVSIALNLGTYDVFSGSALAWGGTVTYSCTGAANGPIYIDLDPGSGTYAQRIARNGSAPQLLYNIYTDSARTVVWGDGTPPTGEYYTAANPQNGRLYTVPIYALVPALQDVAVGTYTDPVLATIYWTKKNVTNSVTVPATVTVNVQSSCTVATSPIVFGAYDPVGANAAAPLSATGAVMTTCTRGAAPIIGLDAGRNPSGALRQMSDAAGHVLPYGLFQDPAHSIAWGNADPALLHASAGADQSQRSFPVYGQIPGGQDPAVGSYTDVVTATVTY